MIDSIEKYIEALRLEMADCDPAICQDAVTDAEDHLHSALADALDKTPSADIDELTSQLIEEYGMPAETAEAYRELENRYSSTIHGRRRRKTGQSSPGRFFAIFSDTSAWSAMLYCLLSLATGVLYFSWAVTGVSVSASLLVLIIGIPIAMGFFFSFHGLAFIEGRLVEALLGERMPRNQRFFRPDMSWPQKIKRVLLAKDSWLIILYQIMMLPLGIIYFTLVVTLVSVSVAFMASPFAALVFNFLQLENVSIVWIIPQWVLPLVAVLGLLLLKATLHLVRKIGWAHGRLAKKMLVVRPGA